MQLFLANYEFFAIFLEGYFFGIAIVINTYKR
jgi:hypothetical protein